jgi:hypothetical protein
MTLEAIMNADMKRRCPEEPRAAMNLVFNLCKR